MAYKSTAFHIKMKLCLSLSFVPFNWKFADERVLAHHRANERTLKRMMNNQKTDTLKKIPD